MKYINLTPRWTEILPTWFTLYENAVLGDCEQPHVVLENARAELMRMAQAADRLADLVAYLRAEKWTEIDLESALDEGRNIRESERNTILETEDDLS